jgi:hypothetical protein
MKDYDDYYDPEYNAFVLDEHSPGNPDPDMKIFNTNEI